MTYLWVTSWVLTISMLVAFASGSLIPGLSLNERVMVFIIGSLAGVIGHLAARIDKLERGQKG